MEYPWYEPTEGDELHQGDILRRYPIFSPQIESEHLTAIAMNTLSPEVDVKCDLVDVIVMTQSCDLSNDKVDSVILCPVWGIEKIKDVFGNNNKEQCKRLEDIRQGKESGWHMLAESSAHNVPISVVEFHRIYTTRKAILTTFAEIAGSRIRLLPPYREHMSQAFARYFMRVGLPSDICRFK